MSRPTRSRQDLRLDVLGKIDPVSEPKESACTSDSDATEAPSAEEGEHVDEHADD